MFSMMPRISIRRATAPISALVALLFAVPVAAGEMRTECPSLHPERPNVSLDYGECLPDGENKWVHVADETIDHGDNVFTGIDIHKTPGSPPLRKARLECKYKDRSVVRIPIPGELLQCGIRYKLPKFLETDDKKKAEGEWMVLGVWAISEVNDVPPPK